MKGRHHDEAGRKAAAKVFVAQLLVTALISGTVSQTGMDASLSALLGGGIAMAGSAILAMGAFRSREGVSDKVVMLSAYGGEVARILAVCVFFFLAFRFWPTLDALAMIGTFIANQVVHLIGALNLRHAE